MKGYVSVVFALLVTVPATAQLNPSDATSLNSAQVVYTRLIVVNADGTNSANGTALLNALAGITTAAADNRFVIQLEPGTYDLGSTSLIMKPFVDLKGSGQNSTTVTSGVSGAAMIDMADGTQARNIEIVNTSSNSSVVRVSGAVASFWRVRFVHQGTRGSNTGLFIEDSGATASNVTLKACDISVRGSNSTGFNRGIDVTGSSRVMTVLTGVVVGGSTSENSGMFLHDLSSASLFRTAVISRGTGSVGLKMSPGVMPHLVKTTGCTLQGADFSLDAGGSPAVFATTGFVRPRTGITSAVFMQCYDPSGGVFAPITNSRAPVAP